MDLLGDLAKLEKLSIVSKISSELSNHIGLQDKVLAEFILHLHETAKDLEAFKEALGGMGADFPESFVENLDRLIRTLQPNKGGKAPVKKPSTQDTGKFPGLAIPDDSERVKRLEEEVLIVPVPEKKQGERIRELSEERNSRRDGRRRRERSRSRSRSRSPVERRGRKRDRAEAPRKELDLDPVLYKVYEGKVTNVKDFGAFVGLIGLRQKAEGLVHISNLLQTRVNHPSDVVNRGDTVWVKVINLENGRIGLSMKDVNQETGRDLAAQDLDLLRNPDRPMLSAGDNPLLNAIGTSYSGKRKRLTSPERFEIKQLIAAGVLNPSEYPDFDEDQGGIDGHVEMEEELDIEIKDEEPLFLKGQIKTAIELSPIKIVKNPDGSMNRAAMNGASLAKERRELKQEKEKETKATGKSALEEDTTGGKVEWRRQTAPGQVSYGKITSLSIEEQRRSLPIYKLRQTIIKAVDENQVLILVGDTGSGKVHRTFVDERKCQSMLTL